MPWMKRSGSSAHKLFYIFFILASLFFLFLSDELYIWILQCSSFLNVSLFNFHLRLFHKFSKLHEYVSIVHSYQCTWPYIPGFWDKIDYPRSFFYFTPQREKLSANLLESQFFYRPTTALPTQIYTISFFIHFKNDWGNKILFSISCILCTSTSISSRSTKPRCG